jgi:hypothetical protein
MIGRTTEISGSTQMSIPRVTAVSADTLGIGFQEQVSNQSELLR